VIDRRSLLSTLLRLSLAVGLCASSRGRIASGLEALYRGDDATVELGRTYLRMEPGESDQATLARLIAAPELGSSTLPGPEAIRRLVARQVQEDFDRSDVVSVRGWLLARTEARICALAALRSGRAR
jgi:hypothetical protein